MFTMFELGTGIFWTLTYILVIRIGLRERTYGMPIVAFATNISWEFCFAFVRPSSGLQHWINIVWFAFDCAIAYTIVRYGPREFPYLSRRVFYAALVVLLALAYVGMNEASIQFDGGAGTITAFLDNLAMSGLFLAMLGSRGGSRGQSVWIAAAKLLGTGCASLTMLASTGLAPRYHTALMYYLYIAVFVLDAAYLGALIIVRRAEAAGALQASPSSAGSSPLESTPSFG